ncbi:MAG: PKD domain-containing protein [Bacteroidetes bacterium]|nr:MAG: PKD domain-containing protein [Bacteroidota bacterium]
MFRLRAISIFLYLLMIASISHAQLTNIWYFGEQAGISFNPQPGGSIPSVLTNSAMSANECAATICDNNGQILFYSNGETIYNKNHQVMQNGSGLLGHSSSFQGVVIVPQPGNDSIYYVFTGDAFERNYVNGYRYSIVNIRRNAGLGEVISKNNLLYAPSTERLTAARHANGIDVWVITNDLNSNVFRAYLVNCSGLQTTPVISTIGEVMNLNIYMPFGSLKVSPDGKQLCQTHFPDDDDNVGENFFQLFDFNNSTGVLSNSKKIAVQGSKYFACEYSPDSRLLYLTKAYTTTIDQVEPKLTTEALIAASRVSIPALGALYGIQIAPDNKIYVARQTTGLSVITEPNVKGMGCNFEANKISLSTFAGLNLPTYINDIAFNSAIQYSIADSCAGSVQFQVATSLSGTLNYNWDFGDGQTSILQNPVHTFPANNEYYTVKVKVTSLSGCGTFERSTLVFAGGIVANAGYSFVSRCDSGYVRFINESSMIPAGDVQYIWDFGDGVTSTDRDPIHTFPGSGIYNVKLKLKTTTSCLDDSLTQQLDLQLLDITASADQVIDIGQTVQLNVTGGGTQFQWTPPQWLNDPVVANPVSTPQDDIRYVVRATNASGCFDTDTVFIKVRPVDSIYVPNGFTPNNDGLNDDFKPIMGIRFTLESFFVFNRWGQQVFFTKQKDLGWKGKFGGIEQSAGVYVWYLTAKDRAGNPVKMQGTVMLVR